MCEGTCWLAVIGTRMHLERERFLVWITLAKQDLPSARTGSEAMPPPSPVFAGPWPSSCLCPPCKDPLAKSQQAACPQFLHRKPATPKAPPQPFQGVAFILKLHMPPRDLGFGSSLYHFQIILHPLWRKSCLILGSRHPTKSPSPPTFYSASFPIIPCGRDDWLFPNIWFLLYKYNPQVF